MLIPIIVGVLAVFLTCLSQSRQNGWGLKAAFGIIFVFLALRYDYGNDYVGYLEMFEEVFYSSKLRSFDLLDFSWEPGWVLLNVIFKPFGFFAMVMFTSLLTCVVFYRFIRNFVPAPYQWLAMFLYVFGPTNMLIPASAMRQNMSILLFMVGVEFLYKKRFVGYFLLVAAGWSFHKSALVLFPIAALAFVNIRISKFFAVMCLFIYVSLYVYGSQVFSLVIRLTGGYFDRYISHYGKDTAELGTGLGLAYAVFLLVGVLYFAGVEFLRFEGGENEEDLSGQVEMYPNPAARRLLFKLAILSFMFTPLGFQVAMVSRINMFFLPVFIAVYPIIAATTRNGLYRLMLLGSLIPFTIYVFVTFFSSMVWKGKFGTYQTIFSALNWM